MRHLYLHLSRIAYHIRATISKLLRTDQHSGTATHNRIWTRPHASCQVTHSGSRHTTNQYSGASRRQNRSTYMRNWRYSWSLLWAGMHVTHSSSRLSSNENHWKTTYNYTAMSGRVTHSSS